MRVWLASYVLPVTGAPIEAGGVAEDRGLIVAVGSASAVIAAAGPDAELVDLGRAALLPGLINAHVHVELSWMGGDPPPGGDFVRWVRGLLERRAAGEPPDALLAARRAIEFIERRGTVAVGDVANGTWVAEPLVHSRLHGVLFHEVYAPLAEVARETYDSAVARVAALDPNERWRFVPAPHAPHTTSPALVRLLAAGAAAAAVPLSVHAAESPAEVDWLRDGSGAFSGLLPDLPPAGDSPVDLLNRAGALGPRTLAVHCVQLDDVDIATLRASGATVVTCPRSNSYLGVGAARVPELVAAGIPLALGTDSLASAPDLDLFGEMAALAQLHPGLAHETILRMATLQGARALGLDDRLGSLERGKLARMVAVPLADGADPWAGVCALPSEIRCLG